MLVRGQRAHHWVSHGVVAAGVILVAAAVDLSSCDTAATGVASVFSLCGIGLLHFSTGRAAQLHTAFQLSAVAASLAWRGTRPGVVAAQVLVQLALVVVGKLVLRAADSVRDSETAPSA